MDTAYFSQKLAMCLLLRSDLDEYSSVVVTLSHTAFVFLLWLRLRENRGTQTQGIALLLFSCVIGLQIYSLVNAARYARTISTVAGTNPSAGVHGTSSSAWQFGFNIALFCYVVGCIAFCSSSAAWCLMKTIRGPVTRKRLQKAMLKSHLNHSLWVTTLPGHSKRTRAARRQALLAPNGRSMTTATRAPAETDYHLLRASGLGVSYTGTIAPLPPK